MSFLLMDKMLVAVIKRKGEKLIDGQEKLGEKIKWRDLGDLQGSER